jgi:amino acid adenylation domain-containing protein
MSRSSEPDYATLLKRSLATIEDLEQKLASAAHSRGPIAIVGTGCRFPGGGDGPDAYWQALLAGVDAIAEVPPDRFDVDAVYDPDPEAPGKAYTRTGSFLEGVDRFDPQFFGISPREARSMDPQQRLLLEVTWEALEHAGIAPGVLAGSRTGVFVGVSGADYAFDRTAVADPAILDGFFGTGLANSVAAGRLSYTLGLQGPSIAIDTACSSSLVAVHLACQSLRSGESDAALAGGVNLILSPQPTIIACRAKMLSPDGRCKTFDASADGYGRGEGCGVVVLKRLSDARSAGDRVLAVIEGSALNQDGRSAGLAAPNGLAQEAVIRGALEDAGIDPLEVGYVEAHGTGTSLGDPIEIRALAATYGQGRPADAPLFVGSVKTNIGHLEAAAGIAGLVKVVLALQHGELPPHLHVRNPNPYIPWNELPIAVPTSRAPWQVSPGARRAAGLSSFGFSGTNAHLVVAEAPIEQEVGDSTRPLHLLAVSARTDDALRRLAGSYAATLGGPEPPRLGDVCATAGAGRAHHAERLAVVAGSSGEAAVALLAAAAGRNGSSTSRGSAPARTPEVAFLFTGQGSQYPSMGRGLYEAEPAYREALDRCAALLEAELDVPLLDLLFTSSEDDSRLDDTTFTQPTLFSLEYALAALVQSYGVKPGAVAGHSVGEIVAACLAGVLPLEDALRLVAARGRLMGSLPRDGAMAAVFADEARIAETLAPYASELAVAAVNAPETVVVSGRVGAVDSVIDALGHDGILSRRLRVSHAFHSPLVEPMLDPFREVCESLEYGRPQIALVSNVTGELAGDEVAAPGYWVRHAREAVRFRAGLEALHAEGITVFLELGPGPTLTGLGRATLTGDATFVHTLEPGADDARRLLEALGDLYCAGADLDWDALRGGERRRSVALPTYPFERERCWLDRPAGRSARGQDARHPLLETRLEAPIPIFQTHLGAGAPAYLGDHEVGGATLLPATAYVELALAAGGEVMAGPLEVRDLVLQEALVLPESGGRAVQVVLVQGADGEMTVQLFSGTGISATRGEPSSVWRLHASGRVGPATESPRPTLELDTERTMIVDSLDPADLYRDFSDAGADYGPAFRTLVQAWRGENRALAKVSLPEGLSAEGYEVHPALLDGCFQLLGVALPPRDGRTVHVPVRIGSVRLHERPGDACWCLAAVAEDGSGIVGELQLVDEGGTVLAELTGIELAPVERRTFAPAAEQLEDWLYEVEWRDALREPVTGDPGRWLISSADPASGAAIADALRSRGADVDLVEPEQAADALDLPGLHGIALVAPAFSGPTLEATAAMRQRAITPALSLLKKLADREAPPRLCIVTRGAQPGATAIDPSQAMLWGLGAVVDAEHPELRCTLIDLDPADDPSVAAENLAGELLAAEGESRVALRDDARKVARLVRSNAPATSEPTPVRPDATYLVTGGLGGLGLLVAGRLVALGARHLVLAGRRPPSPDAATAIALLEAEGAEVRVEQIDVSLRSDLQRLLAPASPSRPPLAGIVHAAGVLDDGVLVQQSADRFARVLAPKVDGAVLLHELTLDLDLDFFCLFAAGAGLLGSPGQGNYAAANAFLDALAHHRRLAGLPAVAIDWGAWDGVGMTASVGDRGERRWATRGIDLIAPEQGLVAFERALQSGKPQIAVLPVRWRSFSRGAPGRVPALLADLAGPSPTGGGAGAEPELARRLREAAGGEQAAVLREHVRRQAMRVLGLDDPRAIDADRPLAELGLDSLTAVELRNALATATGRVLPATLLFDYPTVASLADYLAALAEDRGVTGAATRERRVSDDEPVAIVGVGCRFPGAGDPEAYWRLLADRVDAMSEVPPERWDIDEFYDPQPNVPGKMVSRFAGFVGDVAGFDPQFFGVAPREAPFIDPQQRLFLEVAWEALEDAGIPPGRLAGTQTGVYVGVSGSDYSQRMLRDAEPEDIAPYLGTGNAHSAIAGRLAYLLGLHGPNLAVDTACSSSLVAVHLACQALRSGECDAALAGGVNLLLAPEGSIVFSLAGMLAPDGRSKAFDAAADGYGRGEGAGALVLKRLSDAIDANDRVLAVIRGSAINQDGRSQGLSAPNGLAQQAVVRQALAAGGVDPLDVDYVEAHGTGTPLGDPIEIQALAAVLGEGRDRERPLLVGSVKTNVGHLESAAGMSSLIKVVLALHHGEIPPQLHFRIPTPAVDWDALPVKVVADPVPWPAGGRPRIAGVSGFGFSGTNAHVIVEEAPASAPSPVAVERPLHLLALSAQSPTALEELASRYEQRLESGDAADVCFSANTGRSHFGHRLAVTGADGSGLRARLAEYGAGEREGIAAGRARPAEACRVAFLFTGQGAQYAGMGQRLYETQQTFREALDRCDDLLRPHLDRPLLSVLFPAEGVPSPIDDTAYTQPALFALEYALAELLASFGVRPSAVLGHSIGEYVAAHLAGIMSLEDALALVAARGRLMSSLPRDGAMAAVLADEATVVAAVAPHADQVSIAALNGPSNVVVSGRAAAVETVLAALAADGIDARPLTVSHAFHSPLMEPILDEFEQACADVDLGSPRLPLASNVTGAIADGEVGTAAYWRSHLRSPVRFADGVRALSDSGIDVFLEVGPSPTLSGLAAASLSAEATILPTLRRGRDDWEQLLDSLARLFVAGAEIDWVGFDRPYARQRVAVPTYPFQRERYWLDVRPRGRRRRSDGHPLLGSRVRSPVVRDHVFEALIASDEPSFLADHALHGSVVFPGTGYMEIARAACGAVGHDLGEVRDLAFHEPLVVPDSGPRTLQTVVARDSDGSASLAVYALDDEEGADAWTLHATATLTPARAAGQAAPASPPEELRTRLPEEVDPLRYYAGLAAAGAAYGPAFRSISAAWRSDGEALAQLRLPPAAGVADVALHPGLLDGALQLVGIALSPSGEIDPDDSYVPARLGCLTVHEPPPETVWAHVVVSSELGEQRLTADIRLLDERGNALVELHGAEFERVPRAALERALRRDFGDWLYELAWERAPAADPAEAELEGVWVVLDDGSGTGEALEAELATRGGRCIRALAGEQLAASGDASPWTVRPASTGDLAALLASVGTEGPVAGVVDLWSLQADDDAAEPRLRSALALVQGLASARLPDRPRLWVVTRAAHRVGDDDPTVPRPEQAALWGLGRVVAAEHPEMRCTCVDLDPGEVGATGLVRLIVADDREDQVALREGVRYAARLVRRRAAQESAGAGAAGQRPVRLEIAEKGILDNLALRPAERRAPGPGEVEVRVRATGLNFRDVLNAMGMYPGDPGPLGGECAGVVARVGEGVHSFAVGDRVVAMAAGSFATYVTTPADFCAELPEELDAADAAVLPIAYLTAVYGLRHLAKLQPGERVLIHSAAGGVGIAAVRVALAGGAEVFGTAGNDEKRTLLTSLGVHHVMNSRSLDWAQEVRELTNGEGVDVVLNALVGEYIPAGLRALRAGGRFLEIGKREIWDEDQVAAVNPGITYLPYDLAELFAEDTTLAPPLLRPLVEEVASGALEPLPRREFELERAAEAFRFMAQARHIGKVVLVQPDTGAEPPALEGTIVRTDRSYLVTGGLGGLGLAVARALVDWGARQVVLVGRQAAGPDAQRTIGELEGAGAEVVILQADVARAGELASRLEAVEGLRPLAGIVHAAGVLDDGAIGNLDWERFASVLAPKVAGAQELHALTRKQPVDFFVLFSSAAAVLGSPGQANYAAANAYLDGFAAYRRAMGLPGLSIAWGPWSDVGMAARTTQTGSGQADGGLGVIAPEQGIAILSALLHDPATPPRVAVLNASWQSLLDRFAAGETPPVLARIARDLRPAEEAGRAETAPHDRVASRILALEPSSRRALVDAELRRWIGRVLAADPDTIDGTRSVVELGLDSLMVMELVRGLERDLGLALYPREVFEQPSVDAFGAYLLAELERALGNEAVASTPPAPAPPKAPPVPVVPLDDDASRRVAGMVLLLSSPRSGSTLLRAMLAGHPAVFAPPELHLLPFTSMAARAEALRENQLGEGLQRALMDLCGLDADASAELLSEWERADLPVASAYAKLAELADGRLVVDKSPTYAGDPAILRRAERLFDQPRYIFLVRHPYSAVDSMLRMRFDRLLGIGGGDPFAFAEQVWADSNGNVIDFLEGIDPERRHVMRYEELATEPERVLRDLCGFLGVAWNEALLDPYGEGRMTDGVHAASRSIGDPGFGDHEGIDASLADAWRRVELPRPLGGFARRVAIELGYELPATPEAPAETSPPPAPGADQIALLPRTGALPLSFAQLRLFLVDQLEPQSAAYNIPVALSLSGALDVEALSASLDEVVRRHEAIRTAVVLGENGAPAQIVEEPAPLPLPVTDLSGLPEAERRERAHRLAADEAARPFDLAYDLKLRAGLLRLGADEHVLMLTMHHIASDGWSMGVLVRELGTLYEAFSAGRPSPLEPLPVQYADYAVWQRERLEGGLLDTQLAYWRDQLGEGGPPALELPTDRLRPAVETHRGARCRVALSKTLVDDLTALARGEGATLFMALLAGFQAVLSRWSGQEDFAVGTPAAGRPREELTGLIGFFVNTLVLRADMSGNPSFADLLVRSRRSVLGAFEHGDVTFERLVEELRPPRDLSRSPLFQAMLALQTTSPAAIELGGLTISPVETSSGTAKFDLQLTLIPTDDGLEGWLEYATDLFDGATAERLARHLELMLEAALAEPARPVAELPLLDAAEQARILELNGTSAPIPPDRLEELVSKQAATKPDAVAVVAGTDELTYGELERRSNRLARRLRALGVVRETIVGVCLDRNCEMVVSLLAVAKAGGAWLPLDPAFPADRLVFMLEDAEAPVVITETALGEIVPAGSASLLFVDADPALERESDEPLEGDGTNEELAYLIYTSGSTGRPKGVELEHRSVVNFVLSMSEEPGLTASDVLVSVTTLSFDIAVLELFVPLVVGGRVVLADRETVMDGRALAALLERSRATVMQATPTTWRLLVDSGWGGDPRLKMLCGGEALPRDLAQALLARGGELWNMYGPTETTIWSAVERVQHGDGPVPIGGPIANTKLYVVDAVGGLAPLGVLGELWIGGDGVARGYRERPELTAERFVPDPFDEGGRAYRTGDVARLRGDGRVEFFGRADAQVKVRGFRVELGEIEQAVLAHPGVREAVCIVREDTPGDRRLVAYMVSDGDAPSAGELRSLLARTLPDYMIPSAYVALERLPLTPNRKVDRKALPAPDGSRPDIGRDYTPPATPTEQAIAQIWQDLLAVEAAGRDDNFFDLGGHSLLAVECVARMESELNYQISARELIYQTLRQVAAVCEAAPRADQKSSRRSLVRRLGGRRAGRGVA